MKAVVKAHRSERGQAMTEMALIMPSMVVLLVGLFLAGVYVFRAAVADYGVFISGVATGAYKEPATEQALRGVVWSDLRGGITAGAIGDRQVRSRITISKTQARFVGVDFTEFQRAVTHFRLWRFYPGPPPPGGWE